MSQSFSNRRKFWAPCQALQPEVQAWGGGGLRAFAFKGHWDLRTGAAQAWGKQGVNSWKMHKVSQALRPRGKQCLHRSLGQTCLLVLDSLFCRQGLAVLYSGDKDAGGRGPRDYSSVWALPEVAIWPRDGAPPTASRLQCWKASGQMSKRVRTQPHPSPERLSKVFLSQQLPIRTPLGLSQ